MQRTAVLLALVALCGCDMFKKKDAADAAPEAAAPVDAAPEAAAPVEDAGAAPELDAGPTVKKVPTNPFVTGEAWSGTFDCGGSNTVTLKITKSAGNAVGAIFDGKWLAAKKAKNAGSFQMSGTYEPGSRHLTLTAGNWIAQPTNIPTLNLDGNVSADGRTYSGKAVGTNCTTFSVKR